MMKQNPNDQSEETKERWAFIERAAEEVERWADWKKAEVSPHDFNPRKDEVKTATSSNYSKVTFD